MMRQALLSVAAALAIWGAIATFLILAGDVSCGPAERHWWGSVRVCAVSIRTR